MSGRASVIPGGMKSIPPRILQSGRIVSPLLVWCRTPASSLSAPGGGYERDLRQEVLICGLTPDKLTPTPASSLLPGRWPALACGCQGTGPRPHLRDSVHSEEPLRQEGLQNRISSIRYE